jgi:CheY-like chemotaxis protein
MTKILIVDDNKEFCISLADIFEAKGYEVESRNSGQSAIDIVKEKSFDVILMDIKMPGMNGVEAFKQIKKISPRTAVIMITAYALEDLIKEALAEGAFGVLRKPCDVDKVLELIEEIIKKIKK